MELEKTHPHLETVCHAIARHLHRLAEDRGAHRLSEDAFIKGVLKIEAEEVTPAGLSLSASKTLDNWTVFKIRPQGTSEACAAVEFLPETGEFRRAGSCPVPAG